MTFFTLLGKEFLNLKKSMGVIVILFLVPVFIILIMGYAFADNEVQYRLGVVNEEQDNEMAENIVKNLGEADALAVSSFEDEMDAQTALEKEEILGYIRIPAGFAEDEERGEAKIDFVINNNSPVNASALESIIKGYIEKYNTQVTSVHTAVNVGMKIDPKSNPDNLVSMAIEYLNSREHDVIEIATSYTLSDEHDTMSSFNQTTCGMTAMFILFLCILWGSNNFLEERSEGTMTRLLISPVGFGTIFLAKLFYIAILAFMQFIIFFAIGHLFLDVPIGDLKLLILLNIVFIITAAAIGLLISLIAKTRISSIGLSFFLIMIFSPLGGLWFPLSTVPEVLVRIAGVLPSGAYMLAIEKIIIKQQGFTDIATNIMVIGMYFILAFLLSIKLGIKKINIQ